MSTHSLCQFVTASSVRREIVTHINTRQTPTTALIDELDACRSAVYNELSNLEERGILTEAETNWRLTACGQLIVETITQRQAMDAFIDADPEYWRTHSLDDLPNQFRQRLPDIGEYEIVRGTMPEINKHVSELISRIKTVDQCQVITPVFVQELTDAMPDTRDTRVLVTHEVLERIEDSVGEQGLSNIQVRMMESDFGLICSEKYLCLVLPRRGEEEWSATLVSETNTAVEWGRDLFKSLWVDAEPAPVAESVWDTSTRRRGRGMVGRQLDNSNSTSPY